MLISSRTLGSSATCASRCTACVRRCTHPTHSCIDTGHATHVRAFVYSPAPITAAWLVIDRGTASVCSVERDGSRLLEHRVACVWSPEHFSTGLHNLTLHFRDDVQDHFHSQLFSLDGTMAPVSAAALVLLWTDWQLCLQFGTATLLLLEVLVVLQPLVVPHMLARGMDARHGLHHRAALWARTLHAHVRLRHAVLAILLYSLVGPIFVGQVCAELPSRTHHPLQLTAESVGWMYLRGTSVDGQFQHSPQGLMVLFFALLLVAMPTTLALGLRPAPALAVLLLSMTWQIRWLSIVCRGTGWMAAFISPLDFGLLLVQVAAVRAVCRGVTATCVWFAVALGSLVAYTCLM